MKIIALGYKARQGKTTAAGALARSLGGHGLIWGVSDNLKSVARVEFGMGIEKDPKLLQKLGIGYRRPHPDWLIKAWQGTIADQPPLDWVIVPDMRFRNEAKFFRDNGAVLLKITRLVDGQPFVADDRPADHPSETELDGWTDWDMDIKAGTLIQLKAKLAVAALTEFRPAFLPAPEPEAGDRSETP